MLNIKDQIIDESVEDILKKYYGDFITVIKKCDRKALKEVKFDTKLIEYILKINKDHNKTTGAYPRELDIEIIKKIFYENNSEIVDIYCKYYQIPDPALFKRVNELSYLLINGQEYKGSDNNEKPIPELVMKNYEDKKKLLKSFLNRKDLQKVVIIQRYFRAKIRKKELHALIKSAINSAQSKIKQVIFSFDSQKPNIEEAVISNANAVYIPKCDNNLKKRISDALEGICLFDKIKHYCSTKFITSILDQGLYGHKSLKSFNHEFRQAALFDGDCTNGDSNAICFAVDKVDQGCLQKNTTIITLNLEKIDLSNSNLFFKQKDLGYSYNGTYGQYNGNEEFSINSKTYKFNCNMFLRNQIEKHMNIQFYDPYSDRMNDESFLAYSELLNFEFISSNMKDMHKILVMNFFKFMDNLMDIRRRPIESFSKTFYKELNLLNDEDLKAKLKEIGEKFSKMMEFNAHGSFIIPPEAIFKFTNLDTKQELVNSEVINKLKNNEPINEEIEGFKEVFASRRYLEYLQSETKSEVIEQMLEKVERPYWLSN